MKHGFTLSEVLITLGVVGVVAAMTLPTLIKNYQKSRTANQLKTVYSLMNQAVKMSENNNGLITEWEFPAKNTDAIKVFLNKYVTPYLKYTKIEENDQKVFLYLSNGVILKFYDPSSRRIYSEIILNKNINDNKLGKNSFLFTLGYESSTNTNCINKTYVFDCKYTGYRPYDYVKVKINNSKSLRDFVKDGSGNYGCNKNAKTTCATLIMLDGWKIKDDYPW